MFIIKAWHVMIWINYNFIIYLEKIFKFSVLVLCCLRLFEGFSRKPHPMYFVVRTFRRLEKKTCQAEITLIVKKTERRKYPIYFQKTEDYWPIRWFQIKTASPFFEMHFTCKHKKITLKILLLLSKVLLSRTVIDGKKMRFNLGRVFLANMRCLSFYYFFTEFMRITVNVRIAWWKFKLQVFLFSKIKMTHKCFIFVNKIK